MGEVKKLLIEAESLLVTCLDDWGMTNDQAFDKIRKQLGTMAEDHVRKLVNQWNKEDNHGNSKI
tara:strand:+ start:665 stop:856 length:192 start_codon:yes stop_codon:yes gene_type:complete